MIIQSSRELVLTLRLRTAASLAGTGKIVADIGTDHAFLPTFLVKNGAFQRAIAADIADGPLERARRTIKKHSLSDQIEVRKSNGLLSFCNYEADIAVVTGMGGELIRDIIRDGAKMRRYVIQPMTREPEVRRWLYDSGYDVISEKIASEGNRHYVFFLIAPGDTPQKYDDVRLFVGDVSEHNTRTDTLRYVRHRLSVLAKSAAGLRAGGRAADADRAAQLIERTKIKFEIT